MIYKLYFQTVFVHLTVIISASEVVEKLISRLVWYQGQQNWNPSYPGGWSEKDCKFRARMDNLMTLF